MAGEAVPPGWSRITLGELTQITGGTTPSKTESRYWDNGSVLWATPTDVTALPTEKHTLGATKSLVSEVALRETSLRLLPAGTVMMTSRATIGYPAINILPMATNQGFANFLPAPTYDPNFLVQWIISKRVDLARSAGGSTFPEISKAVLKSLPIDLPPLQEQRRIAEILSSVDEAIAAARAVIEHTRKVKQGVLERLLTKGIGHTRFKQTEIGEIPEGWEVVELEDVASVRTGLAKNKKEIPDAVELPYLRVANVQDGYVDLSDLQTISVSRGQVERYSLRKGDVLMTEGGDYDKLGRGDVWDGSVEPCLHQNHVFAVRVDQERLIPEFLANLTASRSGKAYFQSCSKRSTNLASINSTQVKQFPVRLPDLSEQSEIVTISKSFDAAISVATSRLSQQLQLKSALMSDLLTGRKRVTDVLLMAAE